MFGVLEMATSAALIGNTAAWWNLDPLAQTVVADMAQDGGYSTQAAQLVADWRRANLGGTLTVSTADTPGVAPVPFGNSVHATFTWTLFQLGIPFQIRASATAMSSYLGSPAFQYVTPPF